MAEIINKFNIFGDFPSNLRQNIKSFHVSRVPLTGYILNDNKVYGFGEEIYDILGYNNSDEKYVLINELNDKSIQQFYNGFYFMFARTHQNEFFSWGRNWNGQLARGFKSERDVYLKPEKISFFDRKNIIQISCGYSHCLGISSDGLIYAWGSNKSGQVGCGERELLDISTPIIINLNEKIKFIHCKRFTSFAVSFDDSAYYWGEIIEPEILVFITPKLIDLRNVVKVYYDSGDVIIVLDKSGNVLEFNPKYEEINQMISDMKFIDLYCDHNYCLLQSVECVYQLEHRQLIKTNSFNFFDFYSKNSLIYEKTIETTKEGYFVTNELQFDYNNRTLSLKFKNIFDKKYELMFEEKKKIGEGGVGSVYKANHRLTNVLHAIKIMEIRDNSDLNEIKIMSKLNNDFVVKYIDPWVEENIVRTEIKPFLYIQMELCEHNLRDFIELMKKTFEGNFKTFQYFISCELFKELIECVNYLHSSNPPIIHRDLKPENIVIKRNNNRIIKLCDFGTAKIHQESNHTRMRGTWKYMAPEVFHSRNYNIKSDIYSLALIGTEIFGFEDKVEEIKKYETREDFVKYLSKYTNLETKLRKFLDLLSNCLLPKDYHSRPDCKQLLRKYNEFSIVLSENSVSWVNMWKLNSKCFSEFKIKLMERQENIKKNLKEARCVYTHGMEERFKYNQFYSIEALSHLHGDLKNRAIEYLIIIINPNSEQSFGEEYDLLEFSQELIREMDKDYEKFKERNEFCKFNSLQILDHKLNMCRSLYERQLLILNVTVENQNQLLDKNESLRNEMIEKFKRDNSLFEQNILETYLKRLNEHFKKSFYGAESILELRLHNEQVHKKKQIEGNCREYYKQQMEIKFEIKKFYFQKTLISFNKSFVRDLAQKFDIPSKVVKVCTEDIFNEFSERNSRNMPKEPTFGIDFGTKNSCVAYFSPDLKSTVIIQNELGNDITASIVSFRANNEIVVGEEAKGEEIMNPGNTIHSVRRLIGITFNDLVKNKANQKFEDNLGYKIINNNNELKICVRVDGVERQYFPEEISAKILQKLKLIAEKYLEQFKIKKVVITVPAYFSESQKEATKQAGILAGFEVLKIINEPTAALIAYKNGQNIDMWDSTILVFDFGGGSLGLAIVRFEKGNIIFNNVNGDIYLGGDDIDNNLIKYCLNVFRTKTGKTFAKELLPIHRLRTVCEDSKIKLSSVYSTKVFIKKFYQGHDLLVELTRTKFNEINKDIYERSLNLVKHTMEEANLKYTDINHIVLMGGSAHIPKIQEHLSTLFNKATLNQPINNSVAIGAAIHAATLNGQLTQEKLNKYADVTSMSLGVENYKNEMLTLIPSHTKLPTIITRTFETHENNQKSFRFNVFEGEDVIATNNHLLSEFFWFDVPSGKKGEIKIDITFEVNEEGILTVSAKCDKIVSKLVIKWHNCRLTEEQMEDQIKKGQIDLMREEDHQTPTDSKERISDKIKKVFTSKMFPKPLLKS